MVWQRMFITALHAPLVQPGDDLFTIFIDRVSRASGPLRERDIVCVVSKVVAFEQGRLVRLADVQPSPEAQRLAGTLRMGNDADAAAFAQVVLDEADAVFAGGSYVHLTLKEGLLLANAGADRSNAPEGYAVLWPSQPWQWARRFRERLLDHFNLRELGVLITDSHIAPLRSGVTGLAVAYAGFEGVASDVGKPDLYGRTLAFSRRAVADGLASTAVLLTGEGAERTPFAVIRDAPVVFTDHDVRPDEATYGAGDDLYAPIYNEAFWRVMGKD
jgi:coenzyme F420-0:L-glutamate ligase